MTNICPVEHSTLFKHSAFWSQPTVRIRPRKGEVQLWMAPIGFDSVDTPMAWKSLSPQERDQARRMPTEHEGGKFVRGRFQLRVLLANCLGILPEEVEFSDPLDGPLRLKKPGGPQFGISQSKDSLLVALTMEDSLGVDLEELDDDLEVPQTGAWKFGPNEEAVLEGMEGRERRLMSCRLRTAGRAYMNAVGSDGAAGSCPVETGWDSSRRELTGYIDRKTGEASADWRLNSLCFPAGRVISVATPGECALLLYQV